MSHRPKVVVVDGLRETTEVLRAVLEPQGVDVTRGTSRQTLNTTTDENRVLVLHEDARTTVDGPRVIVGRISPADGSQETDRRTLSQPFQYADLIAAIDAIVVRPAA